MTLNQPTPAAQLTDMVYALAATPGDASICFAARSSGLYRSDDGGQTWHNAYESLNLAAPMTTLTVAVSPHFAVDQTIFAGVPGGILRSLDGGQRWEGTMLPEPPPLVSVLAISPNYVDDSTLFAATAEDGIFRSNDGGHRWEAWNFGLLDLNIYALAISPAYAQDETLFVGVESGIFSSKNGGLAWREVPFPVDLAPVVSLALSPTYAADGTLFAGTESCGLYRSTDRGQTWHRLGADAIPTAVTGISLASTFPTEPHLLVLQDDTLSLSLDGGQTWQNQQAGLSLPQPATALLPLGDHLPDSPCLIGMLDGPIVRL